MDLLKQGYKESLSVAISFFQILGEFILLNLSSVREILIKFLANICILQFFNI